VIGRRALLDVLTGGVEAVGPGSAHPSLTLDLRDIPAEQSAILASLPCPVIGIGAGPAASGCDVVLAQARQAATISRNIAAAPLAAMVLVQLLRATEHLPPHAALLAESLAYATLQAGPESRAWLARPAPAAPPDDGGHLHVRRDDTSLHLTLDRPARGNAIGTILRDSLCEALDLAVLDGSLTRVTLTGAGRCFSTGGDLAEFGQAPDPATAHWVRSLRLPATRLVRLAPRLEIHVNGPAIGAGAELAAFAARLTAAPTAWFHLPELRYGLIPGAGGTVSLPRRIGRQRTAALALSMRRLTATQALAWGLIDHITDTPSQSETRGIDGAPYRDRH